MTVFDFTQKAVFERVCLPDSRVNSSHQMFIMCRPREVSGLRDIFGFDESTVIECNDLDESIRYVSFDGYDFISIVHVEIEGGAPVLREINLYAAPKYLVLVMPEHESPRLKALEKKLSESALAENGSTNPVSRLYFLTFHNLLTDFFDTLEKIEDEMQLLSEGIALSVNRRHFEQINDFRNLCYTVKKQLRAISYLGEQIMLDSNKVIGKGHANFFRSISTRLRKLYDFSESLYHLSGEMLYSYDSRLTMKTNDTMSKLTVLTLFFGPLTVITGIYGMNFDVMPELRWPLGYPLSLAVMAGVSAALFYIMKKKNWL